MTRWIWLAGVALVAFLGFALALAPARLAFDLAARPAGVEAGLVTGTLWDGSARRVRAGGVRLSEVNAGLRPGSVLSGALVFDVEILDPGLRGAGAVALRPDGAMVEEAIAVMRLDAVPALAAADLPSGETARIEIERLAVDGRGRCREAEGRVTSAALATAGERYGAALPLLNARLACAGESVALNFEGRNDTLDLTGQVRFTQAGPDWRMEARSADRDVIAALSFLGFDQQGDVFIAENRPGEG